MTIQQRILTCFLCCALLAMAEDMDNMTSVPFNGMAGDTMTTVSNMCDNVMSGMNNDGTQCTNEQLQTACESSQYTGAACVNACQNGIIGNDSDTCNQLKASLSQ